MEFVKGIYHRNIILKRKDEMGKKNNKGRNSQKNTNTINVTNHVANKKEKDTAKNDKKSESNNSILRHPLVVSLLSTAIIGLVTTTINNMVKIRELDARSEAYDSRFNDIDNDLVINLSKKLALLDKEYKNKVHLPHML